MNRVNHKKRVSRSKLFIDPAVQGALVRRLMMHWLYAILAGFICLLAAQMVNHGQSGSSTFTAHLTALWDRYGTLLIIMTFVFPMFAYDALRLSHRFVGPIYAVRLAVRKLAQGGDIPEVSFRKGDYWADLADDLNGIARQLREARELLAEQEEANVSNDGLDDVGCSPEEAAEALVTDVQDYLQTIQLSDEDLGLGTPQTR